MNTVEERKIEVKKEFNKHFYEGERNSVYCKKHNLFATPGELKDFIDSVVDKTYTQAKLEVVEEIEEWLNKNADTNDGNGFRQLSTYYLEKLEHKLADLKSTLEEKK
jgi:hypothetical protein